MSGKPKREPLPGYEWQFREGCDCKSCPWKGHCRGEDYTHWREVKKP